MSILRNPVWSITLTAVAGLGLLFLPRFDGAPPATLVWLGRYQVMAWAVALPLLAFTLILHGKTALVYLRMTRISGPMQPVRWLMIAPGQNWKTQGWQIGIMITLITAGVIMVQIPVSELSLTSLISALPFAAALAASNSLVEEIVFRHTLVASLDDTPLRPRAPLISGLLFGAVHYFGAPGGFIGVLMAGFLGWLLAKSMQETGGLFWAWVIHFVLDVVIFTAILLRSQIV